MKHLILALSLLLPSAAPAAPCARAHLPPSADQAESQQRLGKGGFHRATEKKWEEIVRAADLDKETEAFDLVDRDIFRRRLEAMPLAEIAPLYPEIPAEKLKKAQAEVLSCEA